MSQVAAHGDAGHHDEEARRSGNIISIICILVLLVVLVLLCILYIHTYIYIYICLHGFYESFRYLSITVWFKKMYVLFLRVGAP